MEHVAKIWSSAPWYSSSDQDRKWDPESKGCFIMFEFPEEEAEGLC